MEERYDLAKSRILELPSEIEGKYKEYIVAMTDLFAQVFDVLETDVPTKEQYEK